jgi:hypothetical protein
MFKFSKFHAGLDRTRPQGIRSGEPVPCKNTRGLMKKQNLSLKEKNHDAQ